MNENKVIEYANNLAELDKLSYYMNYYCNWLELKVVKGMQPKTFDEFKDESNIIRHDVGENWKERNFASQCWISLNAGSIYHSVYHNLKLN